MKKSVGIIGAGQLGGFLCTSASALNLETIILAPSEKSPAASVANRLIRADYDDQAAVDQLCDLSDVITFEFEDIPDTTLDQLERMANSGFVEVFPRPQTIRLLKNKASQKTWLRTNSFATSDFVVTETSTYEELTTKFGATFVQKALTGGIDGRGVQVIRPENQTDLWLNQPTLVEAYVEHSKELAVLVARSANGDLAVYPVVEMTFAATDNVLSLASSPAELDAEIEMQAKALASNIVHSLDGVGIFAIEMFLTRSGELMVNEISPRVHNSGHLSIEAHSTSQYTQHLKAILGEALGDVTQPHPAAMVNLLYHDALSRFVTSPFSTWRLSDHAMVHWYGKDEPRKGRKMGHITAIGATLNEATDQVRTAENIMASDAEATT